MKMEFIKPLPLIENARWDSRHLGILSVDEDLEEMGDVRSKDAEGGGAPGPVVDNLGFDWRTVPQRAWNAGAADHLGTIFRYDPAYFRIQWTIERGIPGDSILFEVGGPGTDPGDRIGHRTHMEIIENSAGLENSTSAIDAVWLPGFTGSSFGDVVEQFRVRVLGIYDPNGDVSVRLSVTLLGGMVVEEAKTWAVPKMVLTRAKKELPEEVTNPARRTPFPDAAVAGAAPRAATPPPAGALERPLMSLTRPLDDHTKDDMVAPAYEKTNISLQALLEPMPGEGDDAPGPAVPDAPSEALPADPDRRTESLADALDSLLDGDGGRAGR